MNASLKSAILCILLTFGGCTAKYSKDILTIHIQEDNVGFIEAGDLWDDLEYIVLSGFDDDVMIGEPQKVLCYEDVIFVSDRKGLYQISKDGVCLNSLQRYGRGPGEYIGVLDFVVDEGYIYMLDNNKKLLKYTMSGEHIASAVLDFFPASLCVLEDGYLIVTSAYQSDTDKFHVLDQKSFTEVSSFQEVNEAEVSWRHFHGQTNFYRYGQSLLFHEPMNDVVFSIYSQESVPVMQIDFYGKNAPQAFWTKEYKNVYDINVSAVKERYCFGIPVYAESHGNIVFTYRDADKYFLCHYSKDSGASRQSSCLSFMELGAEYDVSDLVFGLYDESNQIIVLPGGALDNPIFCVGRMK